MQDVMAATPTVGNLFMAHISKTKNPLNRKKRYICTKSVLFFLYIPYTQKNPPPDENDPRRSNKNADALQDSTIDYALSTAILGISNTIAPIASNHMLCRHM